MKGSDASLEIHKYETYMTAQRCQVDTVAPTSPEARPEIGMISAHSDSPETRHKAWTVRCSLGEEAYVIDPESKGPAGRSVMRGVNYRSLEMRTIRLQVATIFAWGQNWKTEVIDLLKKQLLVT